MAGVVMLSKAKHVDLIVDCVLQETSRTIRLPC